ncbi:MAG: DUF2309 domain-containing protein [Roseiflexaceae bacterium]|nr:DUF2309 domain-containing protein [Roseiflexaceae bacterium]
MISLTHHPVDNRVATDSSPSEALRDTVARICARIPPLWELPNYVAVNPFLGFSGQPLSDTARILSNGLGAHVLPSIEFYRAQWACGAFGMAELRQAAQRANRNPETLAAILAGTNAMPIRLASDTLTFAERRDDHDHSNWHAIAIRHITQWCAVFTGKGLARWNLPHTADGLYPSWRAAAQTDRTLELEGLHGWRSWAKNLPESAEDALTTMLETLHLPDHQHEDYLYRLFGGVFGWASFLRRATWERGTAEPGQLRDLLAIRICVDAGIELLAPPPHAVRAPVPRAMVADEQILVIFQDAFENAYVRQLGDSLLPPTVQSPERPAVQALFCIDVRSEVFRRHLEAQGQQMSTLGFAGFFGVALTWHAAADEPGSARCPVLLKPGIQVISSSNDRSKVARSILKELQNAPASAFSFVETVGLAYGFRMACDAFNWQLESHSHEHSLPFTIQQTNTDRMTRTMQRDVAAGILKNVGLRTLFARIVLLCGHASTSENNPHAAALDCGACGGHSGAMNARVAAALLNDPAVRHELTTIGWQIPSDTWFLPGLHNTTVDHVQLLDTDQVPASHQADLRQLARSLEQAGALARAERAPALQRTTQPQHVLDHVRHRARDWSEVRPEWALARNASFIAARRLRTRGVNLDGRSFLHEYDWTTDPDGSILQLILSAPMVVASWINLQYFASTVDNTMFGCGTKTLHNRIGTLGVVLGNGGDLRSGLTLQSVQAADGHWYHQPLRLQVVIEAPQSMIEAVLEQQPNVRELFENGWVRLFALDPNSCTLVRWFPESQWETVQSEPII